MSTLVYRVVNFCLKATQPEFFRQIRIEGRPLDEQDVHLLVVANHPYGIQDAFLISYAYTRPFYFAATALNFQRREGDTIRPRRLRGWLLRQCQVLPIVRDRREGSMADNRDTFDKAAQAVARGYAFGIFAEGDSRGNQWKLLKLKAGAAQIALQVAELLRGTGGQLQIQVVGLTYTNWNEPFKSTVTLRFAEPFSIAAVDPADRQAVRRARRQITDQLTALMQANTVEVPAKYREFVGKLARFYTVHQPSDYQRLKNVTRHVQSFCQRYGDNHPELEARLDEYLALADELRVYPGEERRQRNRLRLFLLAVPALLGALLHWPIVKATRWMVPFESTPLHSLGDKRVSWGLAFLLLWYAAIAAAVGGLVARHWGWWAVPVVCGVVAGMGFCGLAASHAFRHVMLLLRSLLPARRRFRRYRQLGEELFQEFEQYRRSLAAGGGV